ALASTASAARTGLRRLIRNLPGCRWIRASRGSVTATASFSAAPRGKSRRAGPVGARHDRRPRSRSADSPAVNCERVGRVDSEHARSVTACEGSLELSIDTRSRRQGMQIGVFIFPTDYSIRIDELARALEERGFESLFVTEHTHIPTSRRTPWPGGGSLPKEYSHTLDPFVGLAAAAAVTSRLRLGTGICLVIEHDPIVTAKEVATLDLLSNGRFLFGVGAGWNADEMEHHGTAFPTRFRVM